MMSDLVGAVAEEGLRGPIVHRDCRDGWEDPSVARHAELSGARPTGGVRRERQRARTAGEGCRRGAALVDRESMAGGPAERPPEGAGRDERRNLDQAGGGTARATLSGGPG